MATIKSSFLCLAQVFHKRLLPSINQFSYRVFYICFEITRTKNLCSKFLSLNRFNLFSFYEKDHGGRYGSSLDGWIREILLSQNINHKIKKIFLMTHPRILGYVFNPVSFWFCLNEQEELIAVLAEVSNTFGENHNYLVFNEDYSPIKQDQWFDADKQFYVSPFFEVKGSYKFRFIFDQNKIAAWIDYLSDSKQKSLLTNVICSKIDLNDVTLLKQFFTIPLMTLKVIFLIHWQALKLLFKGNKYISKPTKLIKNLTINK